MEKGIFYQKTPEANKILEMIYDLKFFILLHKKAEFYILKRVGLYLPMTPGFKDYKAKTFHSEMG
jgi:hypothetical protein